MLLNELSRASGVSPASIKFYRRMGLLPPGRRVTTTRFDYGRAHLERLALIRVLRETADAPIEDIRSLTSVIDEGRPLVTALEIAQAIASGLPAAHHEERPPADEDPRAGALVAAMGWPDIGSGPRTALDVLLREMDAAHVEADLTTLLRYARPLEQVARDDLEDIGARRLDDETQGGMGERSDSASDPGPQGEQGDPAAQPSMDAIVHRALVGSLAFTQLTVVLRALAHASLSVDPTP